MQALNASTQNLVVYSWLTLFSSARSLNGIEGEARDSLIASLDHIPVTQRYGFEI